MGIQRASSPDGPFAEKTANPTALDWSTPNSGVLVINEIGYRQQAAPSQLATWVRAAPLFTSSRYIDYEVGGRSTGNYGAYFLADQQFVQLAPVDGPATRGVYVGITAMYAPPEFNRFSQYYELRLYGIGLLPSRPTDLASLVIAETFFATIRSMPLCSAVNSRIQSYVDNRRVLGPHCAWHSCRHWPRVHRSSLTGDLYATDGECSSTSWQT